MKKIATFFLLLFSFFCTTLSVFAQDEKLPYVDKNGVISKASYKIDFIYPSDFANIAGIIFPGHRGPNQLVIYKRSFGKSTGTNEYGREAVVVDGIVRQITGANSTIPSNGFVISGHGKAKKWITDNIKVGSEIKIDEKNSTIISLMTVDSYKYCEKAKIKEIEKIIKTSKAKNQPYDEKTVKKYLKKAKDYARKARRKDIKSLSYAFKSIEMADLALNHSLPYIEKELKGVWVRPVETSKGEIEKTLNEMQKTGINAVFLETFFHGKTIFPSETMKKYGFIEQNEIFAEFDPLEEWVKQARERNIKIHVWFQSFYVGNKPIVPNENAILNIKPEWANRDKANYNSLDIPTHKGEHNGYFLDPANTEVTDFLKELLYEISARYDIDGINLDYVRYPTSAKPESSNYEITNWGYTQFARDEFMKIYGVDPVDVVYKTPIWDDWAKYRQEKISNYIKDVSEIFKKRGLTVSAVIFPTQENGIATKQQNWEVWAKERYLDAFTPLILTADYELTLDMIKGIKKNVNSASIYTGLFVTFMEGECEDLLKQLHLIRAEKIDGVIIFDWAHFGDKYKNVLKSSAFLPPKN